MAVNMTAQTVSIDGIQPYSLSDGKFRPHDLDASSDSAPAGAPSVTSITGTISHGGSVTLNGSNFGTKPTAAPELWDTIDNIASYSGLSNGDTITVGGSNPYNTNSFFDSGAVKYQDTADSNWTTERRHSRSTAQYKSNASASGELGERSWTKTDDTIQVWHVKYDRALPNNSVDKIARYSDSANQTTRTFTWGTTLQLIFDSPNFLINNNDAGSPWDGDSGNWNVLLLQFKGSTRQLTVRIGDNIIIDNEPWAVASSPMQFNQQWRTGYDGNGTVTPIWWESDKYIDSSLAAVFVGNASTWAACTNFEMQIPTSWADTAITVTTNLGAFSSSETVYYYVMDNTGNISAAHSEVLP